MKTNILNVIVCIIKKGFTLCDKCENIVNENNNEEKTKLKINLIMYKIFFIYMYITFKVWKTTKQNIIKY